MKKIIFTLLFASSTLMFANKEEPKVKGSVEYQKEQVLMKKRAIKFQEEMKKEKIVLKKRPNNLSSAGCYIAMSQVMPPAFPDYSLCAALEAAGY
ncbi:hypothetical protein B0A69_09905 [Chryseobacterium shigense]|uniref:Uncharacterized protein n=1 Tax=Chryseobacterium shigense TaxID=297244 RepID=A0A1N7IGR9_9FLAO|nr:hypothetical protein [Chryseobacterium shigense]PQA94751.1 hypothetical protein B0A69_09905 [Chryseobacterium shigense]SIS36304.1 hypothetical protein SAMN05421639_103771 [Chryseobacterium shigense]